MTDWDPMLSDYQDTQFNAYMQGVGRDLANGNGRGTKLFVDNFPVELGQDGFYNLFSEFGRVFEARLKPSNREDGKLSYGFITMDSAVAAERAISQWNGRPLRSGAQLIVKPALSDEQKKRRNEKRQMENEFMANLGRSNFNRDDDMMSSVSGFATQDFLYEQRVLTAKAKAILERTGHAHDLDLYLGGGRGRRPEMDRYNMMDREQPMHYGRGRAHAFRESSYPREPRHDYGGLFGGRGRGRGRGLEDFDERHRPGPGLSQRMAPAQNLGRGSLSQFSQPRRPKTENLRICINCGTEDSSYRCQACKAYYCCHECQRKDWARHKDICLDVNIHLFNMNYQPNGMDNHNLMPSKERGYESEAGGGTRRNGALKRKEEDHSAERGKRIDEEYRTKQSIEKSKRKNEEYSYERERKGDRQFDVPANNKSQTERREFENKKKPPLKFNKKDQPNQDKGETKNKPTVGPANFDNVRDSQVEKRKSPRTETNSFKNKSEEGRVGNNAKPNTVREDGSGDASVDLIGHGSGDASVDLIGQNMEVGAADKGYLTHFDSPSKFWIMLGEDVSSFLGISESFKRVLEEIPKGEVKRVKAGELYCMIDADFWARVKIVTVGQGGNLTVFFPDVGKQETVHISQLFHLEDTMRVFPSQAMCCCIGNAKPKGRTWSEMATRVVEKWLGEPYSNDILFKVLSKKGNTHALEMTKKGENLAEVLISQGLAEVSDANANLPRLTDKNRDESVSEKRFMAKDLKGQAACLEEGDKVSINITELKSLTFFMGHIISSRTKGALVEMDDILKSLALDKGAPHTPVQGELVMAKYSVDNSWYRSEVVKIRDNQFQVMFLDYGNAGVVMAKDIRRIKDKKLASFPALAARLRLWGVDPSVDSEEAITIKFGYLLADFALEEGKWTIVIKSKKDSSLIVDFVSVAKEETLSELLNKKLSQKKSPPNSTIKALVNAKGSDSSLVKSLPCDVLPSDVNSLANVNFINNCSSFYVTQQEKLHALLPLMSEIQAKVKSLPVYDNPAVGSLVIALFNEDKAWYRAQIHSVAKSQDNCEVFYLDYGNCAQVSLKDLRQIPQWAISEPAFAIHCGLDVDSVNLLPDANDQFKAMLEQTVTVSFLRKEESGDKHIIRMMIGDGSDVLQLLSMDLKAQPAAIQAKSPSSQAPAPANTSKSSHKAETIELPVSCEAVTTVVSHIESVCDFYIFASQFQELFGIMQDIQQTAIKEPPVTDVCVGTQCLAKFSEDGVWYRSQVTSSIDDCETCTVMFIDHGNSQETLKQDLRGLPNSAKSLPAMAISCCFKEFEEYLSQKEDLTTIHSSIDLDRMKAELPTFHVMVTVHSQKSGVSVVTLTDTDGNNVLSKYKVQSPSPSLPQSTNKQVHVAQSSNTSQGATLDHIPVMKMTTSSFGVVPTNMESLTEFFCQGKEKYIDNAIEISSTLKTDMAACSPCKCTAVKGGVYACLFDNDWYRCVIEEVRGETVRIRYIDWGNKEDREMSDLRPLQPKHLTFPITLMKCQLHGVEVMDKEQEYIKMLHEKLQTNELWVDIVDQQGDFYKVSLSVVAEDKKVSIVEDLVELGIAKVLEHDEGDDDEDEEDSEEVEKQMRELQKQMEELKLKKSKKK